MRTIKIVFLQTLLSVAFCAGAEVYAQRAIVSATGSQEKPTVPLSSTGANRTADSEQESLSDDPQGGDFALPPDMAPYFLNSEEENNIEAFWKSLFRTKAFSDRSTTNYILSTEIYVKLRWKLLNTLFFQTQALVIGRSGFTSSIYDRDDRSSGLHILEGFFQWIPLSDFSLKFGNIRQDFLKAPLLSTDKTFPSFLGKFSLSPPSEKDDLFLLFQAAIPDNASESVRRETQIVRGAPLFLTFSAVYRSPEFLWGGAVQEILSFFHYHNISPAVADRSRVYGNTIKRTGSDSAFRYKFFGLHNHLSWRKSFFASWVLELGGEYLYNFMAPDTYNEGVRLYSSFYHNYEDLMEIRFMGELFSNQSDSSIAYYNSEVYGHNNRRGFLARLQNHLYNSGLTLGAAFVYSQPINHPDKSPTGSAFSVSIFLMTNHIAI